VISSWRFIHTGPNSGEYNMHFDKMLAEHLLAGTGVPTLRLFEWNPWAISIGHNQDVADINAETCAQGGIDIVRRPTGGRAILHAQELTYSMVMYCGRKSVLEVYSQISKALLRGLHLLGVDASLQRSQHDLGLRYRSVSTIPCFVSSARYEIEWRGRKLVGSAQRRFDGEKDVVLQHGSILCGPAHRQLIEHLVFGDQIDKDHLEKELRDKTTDLEEILGNTAYLLDLPGCIKRGFEDEWGITFFQDSKPYPKPTLAYV
jgi:lipoate-protein ligase A